MKHKFDSILFDLQLFAEGGDGGAASASGGGGAQGATQSSNPAVAQQENGSNGTADAEQVQVAAAQQDTTTPEDLDAEFKAMIEGKYKAQHHASVQKALDRRFKAQKANEAKLAAQSEVMMRLSERYDVSADDINGLIAALDKDDAYLQDKALDAGFPDVELYKQHVSMQRRLHQLEQSEQQAQQKQAYNQRMAELMSETDTVRATHPNYDLEQAMQNDTFRFMVFNGFSAENAYEMAFHKEIAEEKARIAVEQARESMAASIRANGARPDEGGAGSAAGSTQKIDVSKLTKKEREALAERAARGERITF